MNEDEMVEDMAKIANFSAFDYKQGKVQSKTIYTAMAEALYNANYRKVGEDEIVESMKTYERARQETATEILQYIHKKLSKAISEKYGIELED